MTKTLHYLSLILCFLYYLLTLKCCTMRCSMWTSCGTVCPSSTMILRVQWVNIWWPSSMRAGTAGVKMAIACRTIARASIVWAFSRLWKTWERKKNEYTLENANWSTMEASSHLYSNVQLTNSTSLPIQWWNITKLRGKHALCCINTYIRTQCVLVLTCRTIFLWMANFAMMWAKSRWPLYLQAGSTQALGSKHGQAKVMRRRSLLLRDLLLSWMWCGACSTNSVENCNRQIRRESSRSACFSGSSTLEGNRGEIGKEMVYTANRTDWKSCICKIK